MIKSIFLTVFLFLSVALNAQLELQYPDYYKSVHDKNLKVGDTILLEYNYEIRTRGPRLLNEAEKSDLYGNIFNSPFIFDIYVHTDTRGKEIDNLNDALWKSYEIFDEMVLNGIDSARIRKIEPYGDLFPLVNESEIEKLKGKNEKELAHMFNQRVLLVVNNDNYDDVKSDICILKKYLRKKYKKSNHGEGELKYSGDRLVLVNTPLINSKHKIRFYETYVITGYIEYFDMIITLGVNDKGKVFEAYAYSYGGDRSELHESLIGIDILNADEKKLFYEEISLLNFRRRTDERISIDLAEDTVDYIYKGDVRTRIKIFYNQNSVTNIETIE